MSAINPVDLTSYTGVKSLLNSSHAVQQVLNYRNASPNENKWGIRNLCQRWVVVPVVLITSSLVLPAVFVLGTVIPLICAWFCVTLVPSRYSMFPGITHLISTQNRPNAQATALNELASIEIADSKLQKHLFSKKIIKFQHHKGICRGEVNWFLKLYLETRHQFSDPRAHMKALGKLFEEGGPQESVLLQSLCIRGGKLLGLKIGRPNQKWLKEDSSFNFEKAAIRSLKSSALDRFENLPVGAYSLSFVGHATGFIKVSNDLSYFFDPNEGIYEIKGAEHGYDAFTIFSDVIRYTDTSAELNDRLKSLPHIDRTKISFKPYQLRTS